MTPTKQAKGDSGKEPIKYSSKTVKNVAAYGFSINAKDANELANDVTCPKKLWMQLDRANTFNIKRGI